VTNATAARGSTTGRTGLGELPCSYAIRPTIPTFDAAIVHEAQTHRAISWLAAAARGNWRRVPLQCRACSPFASTCSHSCSLSPPFHACKSPDGGNTRRRPVAAPSRPEDKSYGNRHPRRRRRGSLTECLRDEDGPEKKKIRKRHRTLWERTDLPRCADYVEKCCPEPDGALRSYPGLALSVVATDARAGPTQQKPPPPHASPSSWHDDRKSTCCVHKFRRRRAPRDIYEGDGFDWSRRCLPAATAPRARPVDAVRRDKRDSARTLNCIEESLSESDRTYASWVAAVSRLEVTAFSRSFTASPHKTGYT